MGKPTRQEEYIQSLAEREWHSSTMKALTPLERQHLRDWRDHFEEAHWRAKKNS